ncbi:hypothetical protein AAF712_016559 [Marasmius tenuissimus]|uniref:Uncharacterized protein n=1 Tax=Marasmius tenuissimus TaxID=585030 RepID=A0ABR2Z683_9AGAR|nr:hypothetical protein PM082_010154 [Marasmius tenuissimus]
MQLYNLRVHLAKVHADHLDERHENRTSSSPDPVSSDDRHQECYASKDTHDQESQALSHDDCSQVMVLKKIDRVKSQSRVCLPSIRKVFPTINFDSPSNWSNSIPHINDNSFANRDLEHVGGNTNTA